jgi:hypothetical protein
MLASTSFKYVPLNIFEGTINISVGSVVLGFLETASDLEPVLLDLRLWSDNVSSGHLCE